LRPPTGPLWGSATTPPAATAAAAITPAEP